MATSVSASPIDQWIQKYLSEEEPRSKSLIVSVFGDSIAPHGGGIWLSDLIRLLQPLGVNERLVRTSAFRLIEEEWLEARREGRRSFYSLTDSGLSRIEDAYGRIYTPQEPHWDQNWTMVILPRNGDGALERLELRRELEWEGFAMATTGVFLHPSANSKALRRILSQLDLLDRAVVLRAQSIEGYSNEAMPSMISRCWNLEEVGTRYERFVDLFGPLPDLLTSQKLTPEMAFVVQTLLIHSYRRATLHDPRLPVPMLPPEWPGLKAYDICKSIYSLTVADALSHVNSVAIKDRSAGAQRRVLMPLEKRFDGILVN
tara:strand:- start:3802 stop:4749 length:948 start_codon:yes stop_codon:yes gene_type:complete